MRDNLTNALNSLAAVLALIDGTDDREGLATVVDRVLWPPTRRALMGLKDDIRTEMTKAMAGVRREKDIKAGMTAAMTALQASSQVMIDKIAAWEKDPKPYGDADMKEIYDGLVELNTAQDPETVTEAVMEGTGETA